MAKATPAQVKKLKEDIAIGRYDGELADLLAAVKVRGAKSLHWKLEVRGIVVDSRTVTLFEIERVEQATGQPWHVLRPDVSARTMSAFLIAHLVEIDGLTFEAARERLKGVPGDETLDGLSVYEVEDSPLAQPGSGESTST